MENFNLYIRGNHVAHNNKLPFYMGLNFKVRQLALKPKLTQPPT